MTNVLVIPVSPLNAPGLMTARGWDVVREAGSVAISCEHRAWAAYLREAGVKATLLDWRDPEALVGELARWIDDCGEHGTSSVAWIADSEHPFVPAPPKLLDGVEGVLGREVDADYVFASPVAPGSAVVESVRIMHALRSPGGDSWSAQQTHASLARYLVEETYEVLEELESDSPDSEALAAEFGDLLFQLVFHARVGMEAPTPWTLDTVARLLNEKMYRRNPHVFSPQKRRLSVDDTVHQWEQIKATEKTEKAGDSSNDGDADAHEAGVPEPSLGDGIAASLPALQRAFKLAMRAQTRGCSAELADAIRADDDPRAVELAMIAVDAAAEDSDPESDLRRALARIEGRLRPGQ